MTGALNRYDISTTLQHCFNAIATALKYWWFEERSNRIRKAFEAFKSCAEQELHTPREIRSSHLEKVSRQGARTQRRFINWQLKIEWLIKAWRANESRSLSLSKGGGILQSLFARHLWDYSAMIERILPFSQNDSTIWKDISFWKTKWYYKLQWYNSSGRPACRPFQTPIGPS